MQTGTEPKFTLRRLGAAGGPAYRELRLQGLRDHPEAFGAAWEEESLRPPDWFAERLERHAVFAGSSAGNRALAGVAGLLVPEGAKLRHKGVLWGMFVRPEARGAGLGRELVARVMSHAAEIVEEVRLTVVASNPEAVRLYVRAGFERYGLERRALRVGDVYYDELLMS